MTTFDPSRRQDRQIIIELYKNGKLINKPELLSQEADVSQEKVEKAIPKIKQAGGGTAVIDPRYIGYRFPSYVFVETRDHFGQAIEASHDIFHQPNKALMLGTLLGEYDVVHRRVDEDRYQNASFAVNAKHRMMVDFFDKTETYSVFQIARWHGKDAGGRLTNEPELPDPLSLEVLRHLTRNVTLKDKEISDSIKTKIDNNDKDLLVEDKSEITPGEIGKRINKLEDENILLGYSIDYDLSKIGWNRAIMGLSLKSDYSNDSDRKDGHDSVIETLQDYEDDIDDYKKEGKRDSRAPINKFTMPYIVSGVGQSWADILLEVIVRDVSEINTIARRIRDDIESVESTRTHVVTDVRFERPIQPSNWHALNNG